MTQRPRTGLKWRADLALLILGTHAEISDEAAEVVGFLRSSTPPLKSPSSDERLTDRLPRQDIVEPDAEKKVAKRPAPVPLYRADRYRQVTPLPQRQSVGTSAIEWTDAPTHSPVYEPLSRWAALEPRLRRSLDHGRRTRRLDVPALVQRVARGRPITRLIYQQRRRWGTRVVVMVDRSTRLIPYWRDQILVARELEKRLPKAAIEWGEVSDGSAAARMLTGPGQHITHYVPSAGSLVLVLGDAGVLNRRASGVSAFWQRYLSTLRRAGCAPILLMPCALSRVPRSIAHKMQVIPWETPRFNALSTSTTEAGAIDELFEWLALAIRVEPGLLRAVRRRLPATQSDAGLESLFWQDGRLSSQHSVAGTIRPEALRALRSNSDQYDKRDNDEATLRGFIHALRSWRAAPLAPEVWFEELLSLRPDVHKLVPPNDLKAARHFLLRQHERLDSGLLPDELERMKRWYSGMRARLPKELFQDQEVGTALRAMDHALSEASASIDWQDSFDVRDPPDRFDPAAIIAISQRGQDLSLVPYAPNTDDSVVAEQNYSPLALLPTKTGKFLILPAEHASSLWVDGSVPRWVSDWGEDRLGYWIEIKVQNVTQRLRWIPPGEFLMGSPKVEAGRFKREGPAHGVEIREGYWLFDTPCTQGLYGAVMGGNPSEFRSALRPVEQVSWKDAQLFIERINSAVPGLNLGLPSESQWEYACRAGDVRATYAGELQIEKEVYAHELESIAWYGGNSHQGFELDNGQDLSDIRGESFPAGAMGTHEVKGKAPNGWGLYDMLGNVFEWVEDTWHGDCEGAPGDGRARVDVDEEDEALARVVRGGSWLNEARLVRAAYRYHYRPDYRFDGLGFRCARVQSASEPAVKSRRERQAERRLRDSEESPKPVMVSDSGKEQRIPLPDRFAGIIIKSDLAAVSLVQQHRPFWAQAIGRDQFGFWADLTLFRSKSELALVTDQLTDHRPDTVTQRLRWIPPGEFLMGSPEGEAGRYDYEGPAHRVKIREGYWMFDSPCTQGLYESVMGDNPSEFKSALRPVEQVSWEDAQLFMERINSEVAGLDLALPSEAQWEYACRAGDGRATYAGELQIDKEVYARELDSIAWYGGNSHQGFELDNGQNLAELFGDQSYPDEGSGPHVVKGKAPNSWGLYDMLGNVWEWVEDPWHEDYEGARADGGVWMAVDKEDEGIAERVVRGGSWSSRARNVRAAFRFHYRPDYRDGLLGFRCARVQSEPGQ